MRYWLMKTEPETFSLDHLAARPEQTEPWDGVRNYQARNYLRDHMQPGDGVLFYHSNCAVPAIVGVAEVASPGYPDPTQFDPAHYHHDPTAKIEEPRWYLVDVRYQRHFARPLPLTELRQYGEASLQGFALLARGQRLSVMPVRPEHWRAVLALETLDPSTS